MPSRAPARHLGAGVIAHYRQAGWRISEGGRPHAGIVTGPCANCRETTVVYGPLGQPLCPECRKER